jgi:signal recognition particle subunit SEC65
MQIKTNGKVETRLSVSSLSDLIKYYEVKQEQYTEIIENIANELAEEASKNTYEDVYIEPAVVENNRAVAYVRTQKEEDTYEEFGTGIVGSRHPHIDEALEKAGWKYDVNEHGDEGWIYPTKYGGFKWTKGLPAKKKFYVAMQRAKSKSASIAKKEFNRLNKQA